MNQTFSTKTLLASTIGLLGFSNPTEASLTPWTCAQLENSTDPFYRMFPAFLGSAKPSVPYSLNLQQIRGHCFDKIDIYTVFEYLDAENTQMRATVHFDLADRNHLTCFEHLQISTAYYDDYNFFYAGGGHDVVLEFTDLKDTVDIHKSGLRFFTYCADSHQLISSMYSTAMMWLGGNGTEKYIPVFGAKPMDYQIEMNKEAMQTFTGRALEDRIINNVNIDWDQIQTGDILVSRRFTGQATLNMLLSGSEATGVSIVHKDERGVITVLECQSENYVGRRGV